MTCHHRSGDLDCSKTAGYRDPYAVTPAQPATPNASDYTIEEVVQVGRHMVIKAKYPNCRKCSYEGNKVMVFLNTSPLQVVRWRKIDPHFRDPKSATIPTEAPGPAARFPASTEGWADALAYAQAKP